MKKENMIFRLKLDGSLAKEMVAKLPESLFVSKTTTFLDPSMGGGQYVTEVEARLRKAGHSDKNISKRVFGVEKSLLRINFAVNKNKLVGSYSVDKKDVPTILMGSMKFDAVVMNPPFNNHLDLEFIKLATKISNRVIAVHPAISMISRKKSKNFVGIKKLLNGHIRNIKMFNGNKVFDIGLFHPCEIIDIDMSKTLSEFSVDYSHDTSIGTHNFSSTSQVTKWGNVPEYYSIEGKVVKYNEKVDNCQNHRDVKEGKWFVNIAGIRGNHCKEEMFKDDFYTIVTRDDVPENKAGKYLFLSFKTEVEATNFISYLKTDFARFCLSIYKVGSTLGSEMVGIPYLPSYDKPWTKARLTKLFNVTDAEWAFIEKVIPKYYE